jgi:hypothetical protein
MRKGRAADAGDAKYYWAVATNRESEHYVLWPERGSCEAAIADIREACEAIPAREFARLKGNDEVTFCVDSSYPYTASDKIVWSWTWKPSGPPPSSRRPGAHRR